jgi:hypothetical protein
LPADKVPDAELAAAKLRALRAVQHFGVWVEGSRASGMGRFQLDMLLRKNSTSDPEFRTQMYKARQECREGIERAFIERAKTKGGDLAGIFYMKHNTKRYREVSRVELTGKDGAPLNQLEAAKAQLVERLTALAAAKGLPSGSGSAGSRPGEIVIEKAAGSAGSEGSEGSEGPRGRLALTSGDAAEPRKVGRKRA